MAKMWATEGAVAYMASYGQTYIYIYIEILMYDDYYYYCYRERREI